MSITLSQQNQVENYQTICNFIFCCWIVLCNWCYVLSAVTLLLWYTCLSHAHKWHALCYQSWFMSCGTLVGVIILRLCKYIDLSWHQTWIIYNYIKDENFRLMTLLFGKQFYKQTFNNFVQMALSHYQFTIKLILY